MSTKFMKIYNPYNISKYGNHEWGNYLYKRFEYIISQNDINIEINNNFDQNDDNNSKKENIVI